MRGFGLAIAGALLALSACKSGNDGVEPAPEPSETTASTEEESEAGAAIYEQYCAFCHGEEGQGYLADEATALSNSSGRGSDWTRGSRGLRS